MDFNPTSYSRFSNSLLVILLINFVFSCDSNNNDDPIEMVARLTGNPAIDALSEEIQQAPEDPTLYAERGSVFYENEGYDEAILDFQKAIQLDSSNINYWHWLSDTYIDYYKSRKALETMFTVVEKFPKSIPSYLKLANYQIILKQHNEAFESLKKILAIDPQQADALFLWGLNLKYLDNKEEAIPFLQKAVAADPKLIDAWINLGQIFSEKGDPLATQYFDSAIRMEPDNLAALSAKAFHLQENNQVNEAIDIYKQIIRLDPQYESAYFNTGLIYMDLDSMDKAQTQFDFVIQIDPTNARAYYFRGVTSEMIGDRAYAIQNYEQVLRLDPDYQKAHEALNSLRQ